jgi:hypothetical protein
MVSFQLRLKDSAGWNGHAHEQDGQERTRDHSEPKFGQDRTGKSDDGDPCERGDVMEWIHEGHDF